METAAAKKAATGFISRHCVIVSLDSVGRLKSKSILLRFEVTVKSQETCRTDFAYACNFTSKRITGS